MKKIILTISFLFFVAAQLLPAQTTKETFTKIVTVPTSPVKNQQKTGTCWSFATTSFLESEILRQGKGEYDLSEMYFVRLAYKQKAEYYLMFHGKNNFGEGGLSHDVINVIRESGLVPEKEYSGNPFAPDILNHNKLADELLKSISKTNEKLSEKKLENWDKKIDCILDKYIGKVPAEFGIKGQVYTPQSFADYLEIDANNYIELTSFTHHPFYQKINLEIPDNWSHEQYINIPIEELVEVMDSALYNGYSVCWDGDMSEKGFKHRQGTAKLPEGISIGQTERQSLFLSRATTDDHLMHIVGIFENQDEEKYYYVKNSWGTKKSKFDGFLYMSLPYVQLKTISIMVNKKAIPHKIWNKIVQANQIVR